MPLHVLYIEDTERDVEQLERELNSGNRDMPVWSKVHLTHIPHPTALSNALAEHPDVVLADVYYQPEGTSPPVEETDHLDQIIMEVREWDKGSPHGFPTPIIAYTGRGQATLKNCLERRENLYDIWDKLSAGPEYVTWRFRRLASELPRHRPDATIQKLIAAMASTGRSPWHKHMLSLVSNYGEGQTENEQVKKCRDPLQSILNDSNAKHSVALMALWDILAGSEPLLRAVAPKLRGITRHTINVFWVGYWLINHPLLQDRMSRLWEQMRDSRADALELKAVNAIEGFNSVWLLASLFHDAGKFHEYGKAITEVSGEFFKKFETLKMGNPSWQTGETDALPKALEQVLFNLSKTKGDPMVDALRGHIASCSQREKPDHGAIAAAYLVNIGGGGTDLFGEYSYEAARAVLLHSCLPSVFDAIAKDKRENCPHLKWQRDPVACLLLFCDQIQTWDRHNPTEEMKDYPDRAELSYLDAEMDMTSGKPQLKGCIDYIAPSRVDMYPELRKDIATSLNKIILEKPKDTLLHVLKDGDWPFTVHLDCALSGDKLNIDMDFA
jgi:hypothetical protein